jgi:CHAT domain-containing protein
LEAAQESYGLAELEIRNQSPQLASLFWPQPLDSRKIQNTILQPDALLLEYSLGERRSFLWAVTRDSLDVFILPSADRLESLAGTVARLSAGYQARLRDPRKEQSYRRALQDLSRALLAPLTSKLANKRILVVPSGVLQYVPFAALPLPAAASFDAPPLGIQNDIAVLPSASVLSELRGMRDKRVPTRSVLVFADPVFDSQDPRVPAKPRSANVGIPLARLPFSRNEASWVAGAAPAGSGARQALGLDANRATLMAADTGSYRYLHFATHYLIDEIHPEQSGLVLSLVDGKGLPDIGLIRLDDLYAGLPQLSCELVTISACSSALGKVRKGEGIVNVARAFFYAGSPRVLLSLWTCEDRAAADLMNLFYQALFRGSPPATALRTARKALWDRGGRWRDPYFSAGFMLYGEYQ